MNEIVVRNNVGSPTEHEMMVFQTMAKSAVESKMYRGVGEQAGVMMIMLAARELGIPPCQALNGGLNIINGKVEISARMMSALIRRSGHQIDIKQNTDSLAIIVGKRVDSKESLEVTFTIEEAQRAGLIKPGGGWTKWPKDMLYARALSRLARQLFSDVIGMGYVEGEISHVDTDAAVQQNEGVGEEDYLNLFSQEDKVLALEYLIAVKNHFNWSQEQALQNLVKKENLLETFSEWKKKRGS